jgi:hypothetical protein
MLALREMFDDLPIDFLGLLCNLLSDEDVARASCVSISLRNAARDVWPSRLAKRWRHAEAHGRWDEMAKQGQHLRVYGERHKVCGLHACMTCPMQSPCEPKPLHTHAQIDAEAVRLLGEMPWPLQRGQTLKAFEALGADCYDALTCLAHCEDPGRMGQQFWAWKAISHLQVRCQQPVQEGNEQCHRAIFPELEGVFLSAPCDKPSM